MADIEEDDGGPMLDEPAGGTGSGKRFEVKKWNAVCVSPVRSCRCWPTNFLFQCWLFLVGWTAMITM